jgi:hypothetical protein
MVRATTLSVPVRWRSMLARLNRHLAKENQEVKPVRLRNAADRAASGAYFIIDTKKNAAIATHLSTADIEKMAREAGVLEDWEEVR